MISFVLHGALHALPEDYTRACICDGNNGQWESSIFNQTPRGIHRGLNARTVPMRSRPIDIGNDMNIEMRIVGIDDGVFDSVVNRFNRISRRTRAERVAEAA